MSHNEQAVVHTFTATNADPIAAIEQAAAEMQAWYAEQTPLFSMDGASLFQFGMWLITLPSGEYQYIITVLDTRRSGYQG